MYVRRKVFSMNENVENFDEVLFSESYNSFMDGYDFAMEKIFAEDSEGMSTATKVALGTAGAGALAGAGVLAHKKGWLKQAKKALTSASKEAEQKAGETAAKRAEEVAIQNAATSNLSKREYKQAQYYLDNEKAIEKALKKSGNVENNLKKIGLSMNDVNKMKAQAEKLKGTRDARLTRQLGGNNLSEMLNNKKGMPNIPELRKRYAEMRRAKATNLDFNDWVQNQFGVRAYSDFSDFDDYCYEALFSKDSNDHAVAKGAAIGALTAAGVAGAGYGLGRGAEALTKKEWEKLAEEETKGYKNIVGKGKKLAGKSAAWGSDKHGKAMDWIKDNWSREAAENEGRIKGFMKGKGKVLGAGAATLGAGAGIGAGISAYRNRKN